MKQLFAITALVLMLPLVTHAATTQEHIGVRNPTYTTALADPVVQKDFQNLKEVAMTLPLQQKAGKSVFTAQSLKKLDKLSQPLIDRLTTYYHLDPAAYKSHTYISRNQYDSCYEYYNSLHKAAIGQDCVNYPKEFGNCKLCNAFIDKLRARPSNNIIYTHWWSHQETISLVDTLKLKNGDDVYLGFEITPPEK